MEKRIDLNDRVKIEGELNNVLNKISLTMDKFLQEKEKILAEIPGIVKAWGNSAHVPVNKKFVGHSCNIQILKQKKEEGKS